MSAKALRALPNQPALIDVPIVGWICGYDAERGLLVDFSQNQMPGPVPARWTIQIDKSSVDQAVREQQKAMLVFENGDPAQPIVTGLIQPRTLAEARTIEAKLPGLPTEVKIDGDNKRLSLEAADEVVLRCGEASITLRRNGRVVIRGAYVETRSAGVNRIKGGTVQIN